MQKFDQLPIINADKKQEPAAKNETKAVAAAQAPVVPVTAV